ncbi:alpha/beta hydrolase [Myxococcus sp. CA051A]|uniref:alpha/beta fold hydrolase n=1 Tax=unclassified Myxococcus TaxID=2648731 RepID=UPI00157B35F0|nr:MULTISPECIES: alpha/beta hydrolase [unclassified Myxococcus]NTX08201.1 alpha/beta hydrolase [Myxococcus sp. CA040A]NTX13595.1 alpha/beta hydrolase [Myxococcus sp. CA056]NTX38891.1 alpha/beta hydrolase [Myxococcus sp. CA033]NTX53836.1 alpha/beta hydrolase [Myxococcus sp. CA039A]NTX67381.1 alpha/beta hydrolase [Myxococcus sp. CA051A]
MSAQAVYFHQDFLHVPDGAELYYQVTGDGEPGVVLCDGLGCDGFAWKYLAPYLSRRHRVLRWHYRGHGRSGIPEDRERIGMLYTCDDLQRVMDAAGMERAVLFGHSMGVQVALEFHRRYASRVQGLVLLCGSYGNPLDTFHDSTVLKKMFPTLRRVVERFPEQSARLIHAALRTELAVQLAISLEMNRERIARNDLAPYFEHLARMDPVVFVRTLDSLSEHSAWDHLLHVDVPSLVVAGERDKFTPGWLSRKMAARIPDAELVLIPDGTHTAPLEAPGLVEVRIERFLRERLGMPSTPGSLGGKAWNSSPVGS